MIDISNEELRNVEKRLGKFWEAAPSVVFRALNRAADKTKTEAVRGTAKNYSIQQSKIRETIKIGYATTDSLRTTVSSRAGSLPLNYFKFKPHEPKYGRGKKLTITVKKGQPKISDTIFAADLYGIKLFTSKRMLVRPGKRKAEIVKYKLTRRFGPSIPQMLGNKSVSEYTEPLVRAEFEKRLEHEINRAMGVRK